MGLNITFLLPKWYQICITTYLDIQNIQKLASISIVLEGCKWLGLDFYLLHFRIIGRDCTGLLFFVFIYFIFLFLIFWLYWRKNYWNFPSSNINMATYSDVILFVPCYPWLIVFFFSFQNVMAVENLKYSFHFILFFLNFTMWNVEIKFMCTLSIKKYSCVLLWGKILKL